MRRQRPMAIQVAARRERRLAFALGACTALAVAGGAMTLTRLEPIVALAVLVGGALLVTGCVASQRREHSQISAERARWDEALPPGFRVAHDIELSGLMVDHIVVAPTAVWVVLTPALRGTIEPTADHLKLDGRRLMRDPRRAAHRAAGVVRDLLQRELGVRLPVEPVVCFPNATVVGGSQVGLAPVMTWSGLLVRLRRGPRRLSAATRARVRHVLLPGLVRRAEARIRLVGRTAASGGTSAGS